MNCNIDWVKKRGWDGLPGRLALCPGLMGGGFLLVVQVLRSWGKSQGFPCLGSEREEEVVIRVKAGTVQYCAVTGRQQST